MRGSDERSGSLFGYVDLESRVRGDHPRRTIRADRECRIERFVESIHGASYGLWAALDCAGEATSGGAVSSILAGWSASSSEPAGVRRQQGAEATQRSQYCRRHS